MEQTSLEQEHQELKEHFLALTNNYQQTWIAIFDRFHLIDSLIEDNKKISKNIFLNIDQLLKKNKLSLEDLSFYAANQGPGPFTTARSILTSLNGLACATKKLLVGINGIETFLDEQYDANCDYTIVLNNAFCNDVYYAILDRGENYEIGCVQFDIMIEIINTLPGNKIKLIGSIIEEKKIELGDRVKKFLVIPKQVPINASIESIGIKAYRQWLKKENITQELLPLYLKESSKKFSL